MTARRRPRAQRVADRLTRTLGEAWWQPRRNLLSRLLGPLAGLYSLLASLHRSFVRPQTVGVPVIVVGNLIVGGAGKTPTVIALVRLLRAMGWTPGVISRGHGRRGRGLFEVQRDSDARDCGDEPLLIHLRSSVPLVVGADRVAAAKALRAAHPDIDIIVSDDGLQNPRLARDVEVIVFDERGIGNGARLPAGPLRSAIPRRLPPSSLVLYNAPAPSTRLAGWMATRRLTGLVGLADWWQGRAADPTLWAVLQSKVPVATAGIAAPQRFFDMLFAQGLTVLPRPLPDHHDYATLPWREGTADVVMTEKDAVKLRPDRALDGARVWVAPLDLELDVAFIAALIRQLPPSPKRTPPAP